MADYTNISNATLEPNAPLVSSTMFALRDNPTAIAEGAAGAPKIDGAISPALRNGGVPNGELGAEKFRTGTVERDWVLARTAAASAGAIGTYAFLTVSQNYGGGPGGTLAGSWLRYSNVAASSGPTPSGTWRIMGIAETSQTAAHRTTLFLRIS